MNKKSLLVALLSMILIFQGISSGYSLTPGDYNLKFWAGGLRVWVAYPEEASSGETFDVDLLFQSSKFPRGNWVEGVDTKISVLLLGSGTSSTLYDQKLLQKRQMYNGEEISEKISVTLPSNARWYMTIAIDAVSFDPDNSTRGEAHVILDSTIIRDHTYDDLNLNIEELVASYAQLSAQYQSLQTQFTTMSTSSNCSALQSDYLQLTQRYVNLTVDYNQILTQIGSTGDLDLQAAFDELSSRYNELEDHNIAMEEEMNAFWGEMDSLIGQVENNEELEMEIGVLIEEMQGLSEEYEEYKQSQEAAENAFDSLSSSYQSALTIRNILGVSTLLALIALGFIYRKSGLQIGEYF